MSQLLSRISKPLVHSNILRHNNMIRWCSYSSSYPFMLIDHILKVRDSADGRFERGNESGGEKEIFINDPKLAEEVGSAMNTEFVKRKRNIRIRETEFIRDIDNDNNVHLYMEYTKKVEKVGPRITHHMDTLYFPPLPTGSQIQNLAMSCPPDVNNEDWVVAVKFSGSKLKLYRHSKEARWIDIETTHESINPYSSLMYSKKDQRFYVPTPGCNYLCSIDSNFKEKDKPEFVEVRKIDLPKYEFFFQLTKIDTFTRTDHMVEYYGDDFTISRGRSTVMHKTMQFMVFKEEEKLTDRKRKIMSYTENIGDLCIFLGRDEAFYVPASSSPGLKPNRIYFVGHNYGVFEITSQTCTLFFGKGGAYHSLDETTEYPFWPHPLSLTH